ncbi:MAG: ribose 1,5-bisphosphate isomerase [Thermoplasmata archaeon HGW-Thermoplasmata-1]|nr:MAG: ribose 1,5-bisphosphate isomerase [Thermoplasmata archaeon HGW-Thermoplasmata-1]
MKTIKERMPYIYTSDWHVTKETVFPKAFSETVDGIREMRIRGAGRIARSASKALAALAESYGGSDFSEMAEFLHDGAKLLLSTRPTAVSLKNGILFTLAGAKEDGVKNVGDYRKSVVGASEWFCEKSVSAIDAIAKHGSGLLCDGSTVLTHCNSSVAVSTIARANEMYDGIRAFATETRPWNQGHITARELASSGVDVNMIVDSAARHIMEREGVDAVFVGADTICMDGTVANKVGTSQIALAAMDLGIPFYVCGEFYKFSPDIKSGSYVVVEERGASEIADPFKFPGVKFKNPVFDLTPARNITSIITEDGAIRAEKVAGFVKRKFSRVMGFEM